MAKKVNSMAEAEQLIRQAVNAAMQDELSKEVVKTMTKPKGVIDKEVYDKYTPKNLTGTSHHYHRTYDLKKPENIASKMIGDMLLSVGSNYYGKNGNIAKIIETGQGYTWGLKSGYTRDLDSEIPARPYHAKTAEELVKTGNHIKVMKKGLKKRLGSSATVT